MKNFRLYLYLVCNQLNITAMFKSYSSVSENDSKFSGLIEDIIKALDDSFVYYDTYEGFRTNELKEFMHYLPSDLYEDDKEELYIIWPAKIESVKSICSFLENWDMIALSKAGKPVISRSNHPNVARYILEMFNLCK